MGIFKKFGFGLKKTREGLDKKLEDVIGAYEEITDDLYDDLEEALIMADVGVTTATKIIDELRDRVDRNEVRNPKHAKMVIADIIAGMLDGGSSAMMYYRNYFDKYSIDKSQLDSYQLKGLVNRYKAFTNPRRIPTYFIVSEEKK